MFSERFRRGGVVIQETPLVEALSVTSAMRLLGTNPASVSASAIWHHSGLSHALNHRAEFGRAFALEGGCHRSKRSERISAG